MLATDSQIELCNILMHWFIICESGAPRGVCKYKQPMWMRVPYHQIFRSDGSRCDNFSRNAEVKAHIERSDKLHQLGLVTQIVAVNLPDMPKPATLLEATEESTTRATRGKMVLRVIQRLHMNVGDPTTMAKPP